METCFHFASMGDVTDELSKGLGHAIFTTSGMKVLLDYIPLVCIMFGCIMRLVLYSSFATRTQVKHLSQSYYPLEYCIVFSGCFKVK